MAEILKPDSLNIVWAEASQLKQQPDNTKIVTGWEIEVPPLEIFNWQQGRADQAIAHVNQRGIAEWDNQTEYQAGRSYAQGSDGKIYKAITTGRDLNPVTTVGVHWREAWLDLEDDSGSKKFNGFSPRSSNFTATLNSNFYAAGPVDMYLPDTTNAEPGDTVALAKAPSVTVKVYSTAPAVIVTAAGSDSSVYHDFEGIAYFVFNGINWEA